MSGGRPTKRQSESRARNWDVMRLRGLYAMASRGLFTGEESERLREIIDGALRRLNAEPETERRERERRELGAVA